MSGTQGFKRRFLVLIRFTTKLIYGCIYGRRTAFIKCTEELNVSLWVAVWRVSMSTWLKQRLYKTNKCCQPSVIYYSGNQLTASESHPGHRGGSGGGCLKRSCSFSAQLWQCPLGNTVFPKQSFFSSPVSQNVFIHMETQNDPNTVITMPGLYVALLHHVGKQMLQLQTREK